MGLQFKQVGNSREISEFVQAFTNMAEKLKMNVVVALDEVDSLNPAEQKELASRLRSLTGTAKKLKFQQTWLKVLVAWHQVQNGSGEWPGDIRIEIESHSKGDRETAISEELGKIPGLTGDERNEAKNETLKEDGSWFTYVKEIGILFMREPFQRPLSKHL
ncbi:hypothetical protein BJ166DRAFT_339702 [Pestalotiopsis sp. NC0098]|nr:hypothetical protein BJ166DRAFT_339702 [Pestalotiopsis sp. NC0098]